MSSVFFGIRSSVVCYVDFYLLRCFYFARHLAVEFGTRLAAFLWEVVFICMGDKLRWCLLVGFLFNDCYFHQREMISFIKLETCRLICCWLRWLFNLFLSFLNLRWKIWLFWFDFLWSRILWLEGGATFVVLQLFLWYFLDYLLSGLLTLFW